MTSVLLPMQAPHGKQMLTVANVDSKQHLSATQPLAAQITDRVYATCILKFAGIS